ncbi:MAG: hypothetical protein EBR82_31995 [Caulobacteraceae bacterium]|nr:hypothetical protein [Caulobacteraceae bacterium]
MAFLVQRYAPLAGSPAEALWREGEASYVEVGLARHAVVTTPPPDMIGWCAEIDGELAGLQACRLKPEIAEAHGLLSWVRPGFRQRGVFAAIQVAVDAELVAAGITAIRSWVVDGPTADAMAAAIIARGGAKVAEQQIATATGGSATYHEYLRPLVGGG